MDRLILADRLLNGLTLENLAGKYEISVTSVKDRLYRAMDRLERHM
jgi:DNA-directed RNA polymerase specialized sigma24 family protein